MIRKIKAKDKLNFLFFCNQKDKFSDFYVTQDNERLFLHDDKVCLRTFNQCLKHGDICLIKEDQTIIKGIVIVNGYANKFHRKYMKILANDKQTMDDLARVLTWEFPTDLYVKVKNDNPLLEVLLGTRPYNLIFKKKSNDSFRGVGFRVIGNRGKEVLLCRKYDAKFDYSRKSRYVKEGD